MRGELDRAPLPVAALPETIVLPVVVVVQEAQETSSMEDRGAPRTLRAHPSYTGREEPDVTVMDSGPPVQEEEVRPILRGPHLDLAAATQTARRLPVS